MSDEATRLSRLEASLDYIREKLDKLDAVLTAVTRMQTDQGHQKEAVSRAFARLEDLERRQDRLDEENLRAHRAFMDGLDLLRGRMRAQTAMALGAVAGGGAMWGIFAFLLRTDVVAVLRALKGAGG